LPDSFLDQVAPDFNLRSSEERFIALCDFRGRKVVLVFLRHFSSRPCRERLSQLRQRYAEFQMRGAAIVAISFESRIRLAQLSRQLKLPFPLLSDIQRDVYRAYGLYQGSISKMFGMGMVWAYIKLLVRGHWYHCRQSDFKQLGGDFVVDMGGIVRFESLGAGPQGRPPIKLLLEALDQM
jgi:peroxiredoxin